MSDHESRLRFPSGRPIESIKNDAKKLSKSEGIPLSKALDRLAAKNGMGFHLQEMINHSVRVLARAERGMIARELTIEERSYNL